MKRWLILGTGGLVILTLSIILLLGGIGAQLDQVVVRYVAGQDETPPQTFMAGAATVDITPPPGSLPRAGYSTWSTIGQGFRTRLYARAYYLRDRDGDSHVIVQTDLATGSRILHTRLGEVLAQSTEIDASRITLTATHTHSAPGQFVGSQFYNKHISNEPGFAADYFEFLVERISQAVLEARRNQRPARLATGHIDVWGLTRNRSLEAYVENQTVGNKSLGDNRTFHSVNPTLYMVRIDGLSEQGDYRPMAAFASFSIHGTALPQSEPLFNADVWAYIHKDWEWAVQADYQPGWDLHFSAFEGTHGDVAPAARFGLLSYIEARRIGQGIARQAIALYRQLDDRLTDQVDLRTAIRHVNIRQEPRIGEVEICTDAAVGTPLVAAPREHTSPVIGHLPMIRQGSRRWGEEADSCQGRKRILGGDFLQSLLEPKDSFPDYVLFQLVQINDLVLLPLPFEVTTESGRRFAAAVEEAYRSQGMMAPQVMVTSLAGGYTGYVTTPEEYGRQYYEGGHTLYGKNTQPYLEAQIARLAQDMLARGERLVELPSQWEYRFQIKRFLPEAKPALGQRAVLEEPWFRHAGVYHEGHWRFRWRDVNPGLIAFHEPLLSIETRTDGGEWQPLVIDGVPVDDRGYDLAVRLTGETDAEGMAEYTGYWYNPLFQGERREYRFVVAPRGEQPVLYSPPFH